MGKRSCVLAAATLALFAAFGPGASGAAVAPLQELGGPGSAAGQLAIPLATAIGPNGDLYVAEAGNSRISEFSPTGAFIRAWGIDVVPGNAGNAFEICTAATECKAASPIENETIAGAIRRPVGIAVASNGDVFVLDDIDNRIAHYTATGEFVSAFGLDVNPTNAGTGLEVCTFVTSCKIGLSKVDAGSLGDGFDLAIGPGDQLYTVHANLHRVSEFTTAGEFVKAWGFNVVPGPPEKPEVCTIVTTCQATPSGSAAGQFEGPRGIGVAADGDILVDDSGRIDEYDPSGAFLRAWGFDVDPAGGTGLEVCTEATGCKAADAGTAAGQMFAAAAGIASAPDGTTYVADWLANRVDAYPPSLFSGSSFGFDVVPGGGTGFEVCTEASGCKIGVAGGAQGQFQKVTDVSVDCRGAVWTTDSENDRLTRFGEPGTQPCPVTGTVSVSTKVSNVFRIRRAKLNRRKGTASLHVSVTNPGTVVAAGRSIRRAAKTAGGTGDVVLTIRPRGKAKRTLVEKGKARVAFTVTFTPTGGDPGSKQSTILFKLGR